MFLHKTPKLLIKLFPDILWHVDTNQKEIYLTFDDGPVPEATPWVLATLKEFEAKATFFVVGDNVAKHKKLFEEVKSSGHTIGNHSYNHLNGWVTTTQQYVENVHQAKVIIGNKRKLFRPPHGRLKLSQFRTLKKDFRIVMWDVLPGDFSSDLADEICLKKSILATKKGSIIVFHDSVKAITKLKYILPRYLEHFSSLGYRFKPL